MKAILFDCDGTLADSFGIIVEAMRLTFEREGLGTPPDEAVHGVIGLSLGQAIHRLTPTTRPEELPALVETYRAVFHELRNDPAMREALFPGIAPMLRRLAARDDLLLGMVTGKSRRGVRYILEAHDLQDFFQVARTADDCPSKPHPAMVLECCGALGVDSSQAIVVGDSIFDMQMAGAAGARALGVSWGASPAADLLASGAVGVATDVNMLENEILAWAAGWEQGSGRFGSTVLEPS